MRQPRRIDRLVLMTPSMAWLSDRPFASALKLVRPELGFIQPAPRNFVEGVIKRVVPGADSHFVAPALDEFMRAYLNPRGRVAFYAAARNIYLEDPGEFWAGLEALSPESLFIWGRRDGLVPIGFARHVRDRLPAASHCELDCGHVPQLECPTQLHAAITRFLRSAPAQAPASRSRSAAA
jgi:pimeloyl-ACP methyl ester carboxylesterase